MEKPKTQNRQRVLKHTSEQVDVAALLIAEETIKQRIAEYRANPPARRRYTSRIDKALADARAQIARESARATDTTSDWSGRVKTRR